jgi:hypothetical protein
MIRPVLKVLTTSTLSLPRYVFRAASGPLDSIIT